MKFFLETCASQKAIISCNSDVKRRLSCHTKGAIRSSHWILVLITITYIRPASCYFHRQIIPEEETTPEPPHFSRERNPLRMRLRNWSCQNGRCVKTIIERDSKKPNSTEYELDDR